MSKDCPNCPAFGKHCPHKLSGDPYFYDCYLTVAELEKENAELKADNDARKFAMAMSEKVEKQLREENAELKCECRRCVYSDCPCILSDYGKDKNGICDHFKDVFDENIKLKAELKAIDEAGEHVRKQITESFRNKKSYWELERENAQLRKDVEYYKQACVRN